MRKLLQISMLGVLFSLVSGHLPAQADPRDYAVQVTAVVEESPPRIEFSWLAEPATEQVHVFRKRLEDDDWGPALAVLPGNSTSFTDETVGVGEAWEYSFRKSLDVLTDTLRVTGGRPLAFTIRDTFSDGICCTYGLGHYELSAQGIIYAEGAEFGAVETTNFTPGVSGQDVDLRIHIALDVFGAETTWTLWDVDGGEILAEGGPYDSPRYGHMLAGIRAPALEQHGALLLLVTEYLADNLPDAISRFELDLISEGYRVRRRVVAEGEGVPEIKAAVVAAAQELPDLATLFILGNVPVPYSGDVPSSHPDHGGAWPTDLYYGELDGEWTDYLVDNSNPSRPENRNVPGDGKFDQTYLPSDVELMVGRADLSRMPTFPDNEIDLTRAYLDKDHAYRRGEFHAERRGLVDDNLGDYYGQAFAATAWRNFPGMFGRENVHALDYFGTMREESYLWSYGCGPGSYISCMGVGGTITFAEGELQTVFTLLFGSYFGDWDNENNLLRAPLAAAGMPLTCAWGGRPAWHLHPMALGRSIGFCARMSQNNDHLYGVSTGGRLIGTSLMGDPTLCMYLPRPARDLSLWPLASGGVRLDWLPSEDEVIGYHVYRAVTLGGVFERINVEPVSGVSFTDPAPLPDTNVYLLRTLALEQSASGSFHVLSAGLIDSIKPGTAVSGPPQAVILRFDPGHPNPFNPHTQLEYSLSSAGMVDLDVISVEGRVLRRLIDGKWRAAGRHEADWDGRDDDGRRMASGVYLCRLQSGGLTRTRRVTLLK